MESCRLVNYPTKTMDSNKEEDEIAAVTCFRRPYNYRPSRFSTERIPLTFSSLKSFSFSSSDSLSPSSSSSSSSSPPNIFSSINLKMFLSSNYSDIANHGIELTESGMFEKAIEYLSLAITLDSSDSRLYYNRALCYLEIDDPDKAILDLVVSIKSNPLNSQAFFKLGQSLAHMKAYKQAELAYKKAMNLENYEGNKKNLETRREIIGNIYDALVYFGYDEIKAGFASSRYFTIDEAHEALQAGAFEQNLTMTREFKKKYYKRQRQKKGILIPVNFF